MYEYVTALVHRAVFEADTDGATYASVPFVVTVEAYGHSHRECVQSLKVAAHKAVTSAMRDGVELPAINGITPPSA